jgi:hypothetical protein
VFVTDVWCRVRAECRPKCHWFDDPFLSLKHPTGKMLAQHLVASVSERLGVAVYRPPYCSDAEIDALLGSESMLRILQRIDFGPISEFHFSPSRLSVVSDMVLVETCARQIEAFRDLVTLAYKEACIRNKDLLG